jgi:hypothetical protein
VSNAVLAFLDAPVAAGAADRPAIVTSAGTTTYGDLLALAARAGHANHQIALHARSLPRSTDVLTDPMSNGGAIAPAGPSPLESA